MPPPAARFLLQATGPAEFRRRLRAVRSRLQAASSISDGLARVAARIPAAVLGGDLLATLSGHLRDALAVPGTPPGPFARRVRIGAAAPGTPRPSPDGVFTESAVVLRSSHSSRGPSNISADQERRRAAFSVLGHNVVRLAAALGEMGAGAIGAATGLPAQGTAAAQDDQAWPGAPPAGVGPEAPRHAASSVLARRVREYAELARAEARRQQVGGSGAASQVRKGSSPELAGSSPRRLSGLEGASKAAVETLQRFTGVDLANPSEVLEADSQTTRDITAPSQPRRIPFRDHPDGFGAGSLRDLSDRMADVLRRQALQHGIDLT